MKRLSDMKLVIQTQIRENYGAHDWDGEGECPQHWKCKGGETYVFLGMSEKHMQRISAEGIPTLSKLIESDSEDWQEYILGYDFAENYEPVCDAWMTPWSLEHTEGKWVASRTINADQYHTMYDGAKSKTEVYQMGPGGERIDYKKTVEM